MIVVAAPRRDGRTTIAINYVRTAENTTLVVHSMQQANFLSQANPDIADRIRHPGRDGNNLRGLDGRFVFDDAHLIDDRIIRNLIASDRVAMITVVA